jgi:hypothetical protein
MAPVIAGALKDGVVSVGLVPKTAKPVPVSSLKTPASCAEVVAANCDSGLPVTPHVAHEATPVDATLIGDVPESPALPTLPIGSCPVTPVESGSPVRLVATPEAGVPRAGVVSVGLVRVLLVSVWMSVVPTIVPVGAGTDDVTVVDVAAMGIWVAVIPDRPPPAGVAHVASPLQNVELDALVPLLRLLTGRFPVTPVVRGSPVRLVATPEAGVPRAGVTSVGLVASTKLPLPVVLPVASEGVTALLVTPCVAPAKCATPAAGDVEKTALAFVRLVASLQDPDPLSVRTCPLEPAGTQPDPPPPPPPWLRLEVDPWIVTTAVPDVYADALTLTNEFPLTASFHIPTAVAEVAVDVLPCTVPSIALYVFPSTDPSNCNVAVHVPVICKPALPLFGCKTAITQLVLVEQSLPAVVIDPVAKFCAVCP